MAPQKNSSRMVLSEINVTPLVDVMLVLLVVFMITAPMMQQGIDIQLPRTATAGIETKSEPLILTIKANKKIYWGSTAVITSNLNTKLKAHFKTQKQRQVYIKADKSVDYGLVAEVIAEVKAAGIENVGLVTLPK
jgi:biopolymer transport protein TolR